MRQDEFTATVKKGSQKKGTVQVLAVGEPSGSRSGHKSRKYIIPVGYQFCRSIGSKVIVGLTVRVGNTVGVRLRLGRCSFHDRTYCKAIGSDFDFVERKPNAISRGLKAFCITNKINFSPIKNVNPVSKHKNIVRSFEWFAFVC